MRGSSGSPDINAMTNSANHVYNTLNTEQSISISLLGPEGVRADAVYSWLCGLTRWGKCFDI